MRRCAKLMEKDGILEAGEGWIGRYFFLVSKLTNSFFNSSEG